MLNRILDNRLTVMRVITARWGTDVRRGMSPEIAQELKSLASLGSHGNPLCSSEGSTQPPSSRRMVGVRPTAGIHFTTRILIIDDCTLYRENLATTFVANGTASPGIAWDLPSLVNELQSVTPSVVLLSVGTRDGLMLLQAALRISPDARVIALGVSEDDESTIVACAEAGVTGYHLRSESLDDLLMLLRKVARGESVCSPKVSAILLRRLSVLAAERESGPEELVLTAREIQILRMLEMGLSNRDIAEQLCIAVHTVKNHVHCVLGKLGVSTRAQAVAVSRSIDIRARA